MDKLKRRKPKTRLGSEPESHWQRNQITSVRFTSDCTALGHAKARAGAIAMHAVVP